jgi:hypothetical protein
MTICETRRTPLSYILTVIPFMDLSAERALPYQVPCFWLQSTAHGKCEQTQSSCLLFMSHFRLRTHTFANLLRFQRGTYIASVTVIRKRSSIPSFTFVHRTALSLPLKPPVYPETAGIGFSLLSHISPAGSSGSYASPYFGSYASSYSMRSCILFIGSGVSVRHPFFISAKSVSVTV